MVFLKIQVRDTQLLTIHLHLTYLRGKFEELGEFCLIKADDDVVPYPNNRHAHLASHVDHFLAAVKVTRHIVVNKLDFVGGKIFGDSISNLSNNLDNSAHL